jgi:hypothetical protein
MDRRTLLKLAAGTLAISARQSHDLASAEQQHAPGAAATPLNVRAFGAKGDGQADDTRAIQAAIDHALRTRSPTVHIPAGLYRTTDTLHLGYGERFATVSLVGEATYSYAGTAGVMIMPDATGRPAINVQGARGNVISGISIRGRNHAHVASKIARKSGAADADPRGWLDPKIVGGLRRHGPYAAITIDAYSGAPTPDGYPQPPTFEQADAGARRYSSDIVIDRCWIGGFAVGLAVQPGDSDGNGDFVKITRSHIEHCVYAIAVGNAQSRNVAIRDCTYAGVHTFVTNKHFGRGIGTLGGPIDNVSGGVSFQFMDVFASRSLPLTVSHLYVEAQSRIGSWSVASGFNNPLVFQSCTFDFNETLLGASVAALLDCGQHSAIRFLGCTFNQARRMLHLVKGASFVGIESCMFGIVDEWRGKEFYRGIPDHVAKALNYTCGGVFLHGDALKGEIALGGGTIGLDFDLAKGGAAAVARSSTVVPPPGERSVVHHYARELVDRFGRSWPIRERRKPFPLRKRVDGAQLRAIGYSGPDELRLIIDRSLLSKPESRCEPGDILHDAASGTVFALSGIAREGDTAVVHAIQLNNLRGLDGSPAAADDITRGDGYLWLYHSNIMVGDAVFFGDFAAGSTTVTNVHVGDGSARGLSRCLLPGDLLHEYRAGPPLPGGDRLQPYGLMTTIVAVDEARRTVALDRPATLTARHALSTVGLI